MQQSKPVTNLPKFFMLSFFICTVSLIIACHSQQAKQQPELTQQIVEQNIQRALYPPSDTPIVRTTLSFQSVQIAKPRTAGQQKVWYFPDTTIVYPVLAKFTTTSRIQDDPNYPPSYDVHKITQEYLFYKDEWGKWGLKIVSGAQNSDVETKHN